MATPSQPELERALRPLAWRATFAQIPELWRDVVETYGVLGERALAKVDRYYLLTVVLRRPDAAHPWLYERCREVEAETDDCLDLWAREHYKSTIITFAGSIQEVINDAEITIAIFSHVKPVARSFLGQIKLELEGNEKLKALYPEIFWQHPQRESPRWNNDALIVKRTSNPKEATWEAHGVVDGQPTGMHYRLRIYDDLVTVESVGTPEQVEKTTKMHSLSDNLGARDEVTGKKRKWHLGTRYKYSDTYQYLIDRKALKVRLYPATDDGTLNGRPVFLTPEQWADTKRDQTTATVAAQQLMNPAAGTESLFRKEWLRYTDIRPKTLNVYIMCDPASSRKKGSDRTAMYVVGIDAAWNHYLLDGVHHKMGLAERWTWLRNLRKKWVNAPGVQLVKVGYEAFGMRDAVEHFAQEMEREKDPFEIIELTWPDGGTEKSKYDRIQRLEPKFRNGKVFLPLTPCRVDKGADGKEVLTLLDQTVRQGEYIAAGEGYRVLLPTRRKDHENNAYTLHQMLIDEYLVYPYSAHDDGLDVLSRIDDMDPAPPIIIEASVLEPEVYADGA